MDTLLSVLLWSVAVVTVAFLLLLFRLPSLEEADTWLKYLSGVVAACTFVAGISALYVGKIVNDRQADKIRTLDNAVATQQERAANAEIALAEIRKKQEPRIFSFDFQKFTEALKGKPTGTVAVLYKDDDSESAAFAIHLNWALENGGWKVDVMPMPVPSLSTIVKGHSLTNARSSGVYILAKSINERPGDVTTALGALQNAFVIEGSGSASFLDDTLPDNSFRVVVGPKP